jgi:tetratricopeptide (TPR) repeat protein
MKALEKDRERRYETANAFAADVQRYLNDEPVEACPPSLKYRFRKHAIRNRQLLTVGAILFVSLLTATGVSSWFAIEAQVARKKAIGERNISQQSYSIASDGMNRLLTQFSNGRLGRIPEIGDIREQVMHDASELFTHLIELDPTNSNAYLQRGKAFESLQLYELASENHQIATSLDPRNGEAHSRLAGIYNSCPDMSFRDYDRALEHSNKAIESNPTSVDYRVLRAYIVGLRFDYEQSLPLFEEAAQLDDSRASIYEARADVHADNKRPHRALRDADYGLSLTQPRGIKSSFGVDYTTTGELYRHQGRALTQLGRFDEAIESLNRAIEVDPYSMYAYTNRLALFLKAKRYEDAIDDADIALRLQPDFYFTYKRRALAKFHLARYSEALEDLLAAVQHTPSDSHTLYYIPLSLVAACPDESFPRGILQLADEAVKLNDGSPNSHAARFFILAVLGHLEQAQIDIAEILQRGDPAALIAKIPWLISNTGDSREPFFKSFVVWTASLLPHALKDYGRAIELATATVENDPDNAQYLGGLGAILMRAGKYSEAKEKLVNALEAGESNNTFSSDIRYFLAMTEHHLGNSDSAEDLLSKANESADKELADSPAWNRRMTLELLRREAESLIRSESTDSDGN